MSQSYENGRATLPEYGSKPRKPGLYLGLFHGRISPNEQMSGWGFNGPAIGPLRWCHTTYAFDIKVEFECAEDAKAYFGADDLQVGMAIHGDMLVFDNKYFGDWTVYYVSPDECVRLEDTFRQVKRVNYLTAHQRVFL